MIKYIGIAFLLAIWHSVLFFNNNLGLSVILFVFPVLWFIIFVLKKENRIENKYGLLLSVPIILLSCVYFIYDNYFFRLLNLFVIPLLFFLMYIVTLRKEYRLFSIVKDCFSFLVEPITYSNCILGIIKANFFKNVKISNELKNKFKSIIIILPIVLLVLRLLGSADIVFEKMLGDLIFGVEAFFDSWLKGDFVWRLIIILIIFFTISGTVYFIIFDYLGLSKMEDEFHEEDEMIKNGDSIKMLFIVLNFIYVVFDFIQIKSLMFHSVSYGFHYAEYARQGFFQLMIVSVINLLLILISKKYMKDIESKQTKFLKVMSFIMLGLTFIIIISSFLRMNLYEQQYGYTLLRLLVYTSLITEILLIIPTIVYIVRPKYNVFIPYMVIILSVYVGVNYINVDKMIAIMNVNRYYDKKDIDLDYLFNEETDNLNVLVKFYKEVDEEEIREQLKNYFTDLEIKKNNLFEYNISNDKGRMLLEK